MAARVLAVAVVAAGLTAAGAAGAPRDNHCMSPEGVDGNALFGVSQQLLVLGAPPEAGCGPVDAGESYIPLGPGCWTASNRWDVVPAGYTPSAPTPAEDFVSKVRTVSYVVDADTRQERTHRFRARDVVRVVQMRDLFPVSAPDAAMVCFLAVLPPRPPGDHTVDVHVEMGARSCDGIGTGGGEDGLINCIPAGTTRLCRLAFRVSDRPASKH